MKRGIFRHEGFQRSMGRTFKSVGDIRRKSKVSTALVSILREIISPVCKDDTKVYCFKEVCLNRLSNQSRRADLILYIPRERLIYLEYKTTEADKAPSNQIYTTQLSETFNNLLNCLNYRLSNYPKHYFSDSPIPITSILLTRHFIARRKKNMNDSVALYHPKGAKMMRETLDEKLMISALSMMGVLL